jgi:phage FluMu gp28-like protein
MKKGAKNQPDPHPDPLPEGEGTDGGGAPSLPQVRVPMQLRDLLLPYQRRWVDDETRFKFGLWSRQTGKDFSSGEEGIRDCYKHELQGSKTTWLIGAAGERQALESLEKWKEWTEAYKLAIADVVERREGSEALLSSKSIIFPGGSRVVAVPANPATMRGYSANVLMTEFAFLEEPDLTWRAMLPSITNPLRGGQKKVRLITTPNGVGNKAHDLWHKNYNVPGSKWSCHKVTIHDAVAQGLPVDIQELRDALDDPEGWAQEFECEFLDTHSVLLPYDLIATCESLEATTVVPPEFWMTRQLFPIDLGIDFARKRDLTVCWAMAELGDVQQTMEVLELAKMSTPDQVEILRPRIRRARRVCLDYTGPGIGMGDYLVKEFGEWNPEKHLMGKIELCTFSNPLKVDVFTKLRMAFERRAVRIPISRLIREDLHSVNRVVTQTGNVTYRAPHTEDGHADRCTALALAVRAGSYKVGGALTSADGIFVGGNGPGGRTVFRPRILTRAELSDIIELHFAEQARMAA